jgi:hypothetical protein
VEELLRERTILGPDDETNKESMTLCIAAECWEGETPYIAMCCDARAERGGVFQELVGSEDVDKMRGIGPVTALLSGDETDADELLTQCESAIRYDVPMKAKPLTPFEKFTHAMDGLMRVPHSAIKEALDKEKREKERKKRVKNQPASSGHVSSDSNG